MAEIISFYKRYLNYRTVLQVSINMAKRKHENEHDSKSKKNCTSDGKTHWALGLLDSMNDPELQVHSDNLVIVIKDKYPKAKFHYLILPKENISSLKKLSTEHIVLLEHIETVANNLIKSNEHEQATFRFGYHAEASMHRLHMHVISNDMVSPCLKTKKHWNSFTSDFFLQPKYIRESLQKYGKVNLPSSEKCKEYMNTPLSCHKCNYKPKNIPKLKEHILTHIK